MSEKRQLKKVLNRTDALVLSLGAMIGWGWVVLSGGWVTDAGVVGAGLAFLVGGALVLVVGLTYSELASAMPKVGGEHSYALRGIGPRGSFIASWAIALGYVSVVAFEAVALPNVVEYIFPNYKVGYMYTITGYDVYATWVLVGIAGSVFIAWINYVGIKFASFVQMVLTLMIILVGLMLIFGSAANGSIANADPLWVTSTAGLLTVMIATPFLFVGFDVIPQAAEEMNIKPRSIGKLLIISVFCAILFYLAVIFAVGFGLGPEDRELSILPTADAMANVFGADVFGHILVLGGIAGILTSWNAFIIGGSRVIFAMADTKMLPAWFGKVHPKHGTPSNAIIFIGGLSVVSPFFGDPMLGWLVDAGGLTIVVAYLMVAVSFIMLRRRLPEMDRPFRAGRSVWIGWLALLMSLFFFVQYMPGMPAGLGIQEWMILGGWWAIGAYFAITRYETYKTVTYEKDVDIDEKSA
ncbi:amino acid permease-associated region [Geomicrobium sp. JCM 19037]|uniref:APC family permease n=1 Tax=unclassified Geomicrobium TaxID=2628951 RepID=UPI00045F4401|nr:APC family permease [Geomicrobium sp. JCM 19037]GAK05019.1 amino acid permease-associated region [Geomicrobium sp. JCM 19037]